MGTIRTGELTIKTEHFEPKGATTFKEVFITIYLKGIRQQTIGINDKGIITVLKSKKDTVQFIDHTSKLNEEKRTKE